MLLIGHSLEEILMSRNTAISSRICHKLEKVCVDTIAGNRVFGPDNQLLYSRTFFKQNRYAESSFKMSEFVKQTTNLNSGADKAD